MTYKPFQKNAYRPQDNQDARGRLQWGLYRQGALSRQGKNTDYR